MVHQRNGKAKCISLDALLNDWKLLNPSLAIFKIVCLALAFFGCIFVSPLVLAFT